MADQKVEFANALRGLAALSVIVSHYLGVFWGNAVAVAELTGMSRAPVPIPTMAELALSFPLKWAPFGVALFFVISGFVIPFSFETYGRLDFIVARFFRIYPTYLTGLSVSLAVLAVITGILGVSFPHSISEILHNYALGTRDIFWVKSVDGIVWTLEVELKFYLICMLIAPWLRSGSIAVFTVPVALLGISCILGAVLPSSSTTTLFWVALSSPYILFMFVGVAFNFMYRKKLGGPFGALAIVAIVVMFWASLRYGVFKWHSVLPHYAAAVMVFAMAMRFPAIVTRIPTIGFWAGISYPLYVVHALIGYSLMVLLLSFGMPAWSVIVVAFAAAVLLATAVHILVEKPSHRLGRRIAMAIRSAEVEVRQIA
jgi:peptidoglycan/LPS O-acetylase OafA/YrhL